MFNAKHLLNFKGLSAVLHINIDKRLLLHTVKKMSPYVKRHKPGRRGVSQTNVLHNVNVI
jgi:hypothetical protein